MVTINTIGRDETREYDESVEIFVLLQSLEPINTRNNLQKNLALYEVIEIKNRDKNLPSSSDVAI